MRSKKNVRLAGVAAVAVALLTGCGLGGEAPSGDEGEGAQPGSIKPIESLEGAKLAVGSKDFDEQQILGQMALAALEAAGAEPVDKTGISGTDATRKALTSGEIDMYWEYTGTTWVSHLKHEEKVDDGEKLAAMVAEEDLRENQVKWLPPSKLNNTYALAIREEKAEELGVTKFSDLASLPMEELTFCLGQEFADRPDGFGPMLKAYGMDPGSIPANNVHTMGDGLVYTQVDEGSSCNFGSVFTSNGEIGAFDLRVLEDDKNFFPLYHAAMTIRQNTFKEYPALADVFKPVTAKITTEVMQELNGRVAIDGERERAVARDWLKQEGFIS